MHAHIHSCTLAHTCTPIHTHIYAHTYAHAQRRWAECARLSPQQLFLSFTHCIGHSEAGCWLLAAAHLLSPRTEISQELGLGVGVETWTFWEPRNVLGSLLGLLHFVLFSGKQLGKKALFPHFWRLIYINRLNPITFRVNRNSPSEVKKALQPWVWPGRTRLVSLPHPLVFLLQPAHFWRRHSSGGCTHGVGRERCIVMGPSSHRLVALDEPPGSPSLNGQRVTWRRSGICVKGL